MKRKALLVIIVLLAAISLLTACSEVPLPCDCEVETVDNSDVRTELILR